VAQEVEVLVVLAQTAHQGLRSVVEAVVVVRLVLGQVLVVVAQVAIGLTTRHLVQPLLQNFLVALVAGLLLKHLLLRHLERLTQSQSVLVVLLLGLEQEHQAQAALVS
jgi:hypothetical protein